MADLYREKVCALFKSFDRNGDGAIDREELARLLDALDPSHWSDKKLDEMLREADLNVDGKIQYGEFTQWLFATGPDQNTFFRSVRDLAPGLKDRVRAAQALQELSAADESERCQSLNLLLQLLEQIADNPKDLALRRVPLDRQASEMLNVRGMARLLVAVGFVNGTGEHKDEIKLSHIVNLSWVLEELRQRKENNWRWDDLQDPPWEAPAAAVPDSEQAPESDMLNPDWRLFPEGVKTSSEVTKLIEALTALNGMDKMAMGGKCIPQTIAMEDFMIDEVGMRELHGEYFVQGVKAFELDTPLGSMPADKELVYRGIGAGGKHCSFSMSASEVQQWQASFRTFYASDVYEGEEGEALIRRSLQGQSAAGEEAWKMKFAIRCSQNPVLMRFDGKVFDRKAGDPASQRIHLISVCGIDFASRVHDHFDLTSYLKNWDKVYTFDDNGAPYVKGGRDFEFSGEEAKLNVAKCLFDLKRMARLRFRAQDELGIKVVVEVGLGLGVFAGDAIGIGGTVRMLSALAMKQVLEEESFKNICLIVLSLPIFRRGDNFEYFEQVFSQEGSSYSGKTPVLLMDQDMHAIALAAADMGFTVGELNPADSHGVFGEYWQNFGPGTEEKLALTTCGLLTQHHAVNPAVLDTRNYIALDASAPMVD